MDFTSQAAHDLREFLVTCVLQATGKFRDILDEDECRAVADLAALIAVRRLDPERAGRLRWYARSWALGLAHRIIRREVRYNRARQALRDEPGSSFRMAPDRLAELTLLLERLDEVDRDVVLEHVGLGRTFTEVAADRGRHRSWAHRRFRAAMQTLRDAVRARPGLRAR